ncbi:hypothetical protein AB0H42_20225 [Nocardia sp. NPDC050799]|uniref:hypothetical protein n=1 Tax=Nocardia sp. NPDC050799 TaxID=3154842 RepID=UPI0033C295BD
METEMRRLQGRDLDPSYVGQFIRRAKNGYHQPGKILELVPVLDKGVFLLAVNWMETPVNAASVEPAKIALSSPVVVMDQPVVRAVPGTAAAKIELGEVPTDVATVADTGEVVSDWIKLVQSGDYTDGITETRTVLARDLGPQHLGKIFYNGDEAAGVNYPIKFLSFRAIEEGNAPGVQMWLRHGAIDSRPAYDNEWHVPFDRSFELVELTPFLG